MVSSVSGVPRRARCFWKRSPAANMINHYYACLRRTGDAVVHPHPRTAASNPSHEAAFSSMSASDLTEYAALIEE